MNRLIPILPLMLLALLPALAAGPPAEPYAPDEHTLFLHHMEGDTAQEGRAANTARGPAAPLNPDTAASSFVLGKIGKALLFSPARRSLFFPAAGNYNPERGTVEFFVRLPDLRAGSWQGSRGFWQTGGGVQDTARLVIGVGDFNSARTGAQRDDLFADFQDGRLGLKCPAAAWKAAEWHHVAVLWNRERARLLLDGVRVAEGKHGPLTAPAILEVGSNAIMILDEVRISDVEREELEVANQVKQETPFNQVPAAGTPPPPPPALPPAPARPTVYALRPGVPNLFVDDMLIEVKTNLIRRLGQVTKHEGNPVLSAKGLWEETAAFPFGGGIYRLGDGKWAMWYNTYIRWLPGKDRTSVCYATSKDGVRWEKPVLKLNEVRGSKENNVVLSVGIDNASVVYDPDEAKPERRYKMAVYGDGEEGAGVYGYVSPDGLKWERLPKALMPQAGDRTTLWHDTLRKRYVLFTRYGPIYAGRHIFRSESEDFEHWSKPEMVLHWSAMDQAHGIQHYGASAFPYGDGYVGFLEIFHVPYRRLDTQLIASRDGRSWQRVCEGEPFLHNGPEGAFDRFWAFPASSPPVRVGNELWFHYQGRGHPHAGPQPPAWPGSDPSGRPRHSYWASTGLARMRVDGFAAMDSSGDIATLITIPLRLEEIRELHINADADNFPSGSSRLRCAVLDEAYAPVPGFESDAFDALAKDAVAHRASWKGNADLSSLRGKAFRLRFEMVNTRLYSFTVR